MIEQQTLYEKYSLQQLYHAVFIAIEKMSFLFPSIYRPLRETFSLLPEYPLKYIINIFGPGFSDFLLDDKMTYC